MRARAASITVHKRNASPGTPQVSVILLDWSVRESFHGLDWLSKQDVARERYELVWIDLYDRVVPEVMEKADVVITCGQKRLYHKHQGLNVGYLHARGQVVTVCDSDAVFPPDYIQSIIRAFNLNGAGEARPIVLMHHEKRTPERYPHHLSDIGQLEKFPWVDLWPNVGASVSVRKIDAIRFGGWDEHSSFRGYIGGADLPWRLVNAGLPEIWHGEDICLYHFAHAHSSESDNDSEWNEISYPHVDWHALTAVEAFSSGRLLPLQENPEIHRTRMSLRTIGTKFEEKYAWMPPFSKRTKLRLQMALLVRVCVINRAKHYLKRVPGVYRSYRVLRDALFRATQASGSP